MRPYQNTIFSLLEYDGETININLGLLIFFKSTSTSLFTGGTLFIKIGPIFMNILYNTLYYQEVTKTILGR
jgi:hypothetical protein